MPEPRFITTPDGRRVAVVDHDIGGGVTIPLVVGEEGELDVPSSIREGTRGAGQALQQVEDLGVPIPTGSGRAVARIGDEVARTIEDPAQQATDFVMGSGVPIIPGVRGPFMDMPAVRRARESLEVTERMAREAEGRGPAPLGEGEGVRFTPPGQTGIETIAVTTPGDPEVTPPSADALREVAGAARTRAEAQEEALRNNADEQRDLHMDAADEIDRINQDFATRQQEAEAAVSAAAASYQEALGRIRAREIDPDRWWSSKTVPGKLMALTATALGAIGGIFLRDGSNPVLDQIEQEIERDLAIQEQDLGRAERVDQRRVQGAQNLLNFFFQRSRDVPTAHRQALAAGMMSFGERLRGLATEAATEQRAAELLQFAEQLEFRAEEHALRGLQSHSLIEAQRRRRSRTRLVRRDRATGEILRDVDQGRVQDIADRVQKIQPAIEALSDVRRLMRASGDDIPGFGRGTTLAEALTNPGFVQWFQSSRGAHMRQAIGNLFARYVQALSGAQASEMEVARIRQIIQGSGTPAEIREGVGIVERSINGVRRTIEAGDPDAFRQFSANADAIRRREGTAGGADFQPAGGGSQ